VTLEKKERSLFDVMVEWFQCEKSMVSWAGMREQKEGYFQRVNSLKI
jgi:hypothetical protein